jgi:ketoreductase RED2
MTVMVNSRSSRAQGEAVARDISGSYFLADIGDEDQARALVAETVERYGRLDLVVNNAGITRFIPHDRIDEATREVWRDIFEVNVFGTWDVSVAAMPHLRKSPNGHIVNITSLGGQRPLGSSIPYAASKAAIDHMTRLLAATVGPEVRINAVAPGFVDTPWTSSSEWAEMRRTAIEEIPLLRAATPDDIATAVVGLHTSTYVTGQVLAVDGGRHLR